MNKREKYIDIAKGIAMLLVIIGHCEYTPSTVIWWLYSFHMPLFFALSGMVFSVEKYDKFKNFLKAKFKGLLVPYFFLNLILWFYKKILQHKATFLSNDDTFTSFIGIFLGRRGTVYYCSMWFLTTLFFAEILTYFIIKKFKNDTLKLSISAILLSI